MATQIVKYHNDLNNYSMGAWNAEEMNFFFTLISQIAEKGTKIITLNAYELKDLTGTDTRNSYWFKMVEQFSLKVITMVHKDVDENGDVVLMHPFENIKISPQNRTLTVKVSQDFEYIINKLNIKYTLFELQEFTNIKSIYVKTLYRFIKKWRTIGRVKVSVEDLRKILEIPNSYTPGKINKRIIEPAEEELLKYFKNFKIQIIKSQAHGTPVEGYIFTWEKEKASNEKYNPDKFMGKEKNKESKKTSITEEARKKRLARLINNTSL